MSNHDRYLSIEVHTVPDDPGLREQARSALLGLESEEGDLPESLTGGLSCYFGDDEFPVLLAEKLAAVPGLSFELWTEEYQGSPGRLIAHASGVGTFTGCCDLGGFLLVSESNVRSIALEDDPAERARLLEKFTGAAIRAAFPSNP